MSPLDFSHKLAKMWGAKLVFAPKNQYPPRGRRQKPKEEQRNQQLSVSEGPAGQGNVTTTAAETAEGATATANTPPSSTVAAEGVVPAVITGMDTPSATTNAAGSAEKHEVPKVTPGNEDTIGTVNIDTAACVTEPQHQLEQQEDLIDQPDQPASAAAENDDTYDAPTASSTDDKAEDKSYPSDSFQQPGTGAPENVSGPALAAASTADSGGASA